MFSLTSFWPYLNYKNVIGRLNDLELLDKSSILDVTLPEALNSAIELSKKNNPNLIIAKLKYSMLQIQCQVYSDQLVIGRTHNIVDWFRMVYTQLGTAPTWIVLCVLHDWHTLLWIYTGVS